jgi:hypothetical protein
VTRRRLGYADVWVDYVAAGWTPVPLPRGRKKNPPKDVTGDTADRYDPARRHFKQWASENPRGNVAIVVPETVVGIDVDCYNGKRGAETRAQLEHDHGPLPTTWESTSRDDGISGIGFYRVPLETWLRGVAGPGIETVQWWYRYAIVWPSVHPEGRLYNWWVGQAAAGIPKVTDLPDLPDAWVKALADKPKASGDGSPYDGDVDDWLAGLPELPDGWAAPASVRKVVRDAERAFGDGSCRHDAMLTATAALVALGAQDKPVFDALHELAELFSAAVYDDRDADEEYEYWSAVKGAVRKYGGAKQRLPLGSVTFGGRS